MSSAIRELQKSETLELIRRYGLNKVDGEVPDVWPAHIAATTRTWIGLFDGELACMWGIIPPTLLSTKCYLWLSTTKVVEKNKFVFTRHSQRIIEIILREYPEIFGDVRAGHDRSIRWLRWLGADFGTPDGQYIPFVIRTKKNG